MTFIIDLEGPEHEEFRLLRELAKGINHLVKEQDRAMAVLDNVVTGVAQVKSDLDALTGRIASLEQASAATVASLQSTVDNLNAQVATLQAQAADPAVVTQLEADIAAIDAAIAALAQPPAPPAA